MQKKIHKTGCSFVRNNLFPFQEKRLSGQELQEFETHLQSCPSCSDLVAEFLSVTSQIDKMKSDQSNPFLSTQIIQRLESVIEDERKTKHPVLQWILRPVSISFIILVAVVIGYSITKPKTSHFTSFTRHEYDIQAMRSGLNIPDYIDENKTIFDHQ